MMKTHEFTIKLEVAALHDETRNAVQSWLATRLSGIEDINGVTSLDPSDGTELADLPSFDPNKGPDDV